MWLNWIEQHSYWPYNLVHRPLLSSQMIDLLGDSELSLYFQFLIICVILPSQNWQKNSLLQQIIHHDSENNKAGLEE